jgi:hypothetical protein
LILHPQGSIFSQLTLYLYEVNSVFFYEHFGFFVTGLLNHRLEVTFPSMQNIHAFPDMTVPERATDPVASSEQFSSAGEKSNSDESSEDAQDSDQLDLEKVEPNVGLQFIMSKLRSLGQRNSSKEMAGGEDEDKKETIATDSKEVPEEEEKRRSDVPVPPVRYLVCSQCIC